MKRTLFGFASLFIVAAPATAADLAYPSPRLQPIVPVANSWNGFYLGGAIGAAFANASGEVSSVGFGSTSTGDLGSSAFSAGAYLGYNWQVSPAVILGLEGEANWLNSSFNQGGGNLLTSDWQFAISARGGILLSPSALVYAKVGWALTQQNIDALNLFGPNVGYTVNDGYRNGVLLGAGAEVMFANNWLMRVEGEYTVGGEDAKITVPAWGYQTTVNADYLTARVGLGYKF